VQVKSLPPWVVLDADSASTRIESKDFKDSFNPGMPQPMPMVPGPSFVNRALEESFSFYLRNPEPDLPAGTDIALPGPDQEAPSPAPAALRVATELPPLGSGLHYVSQYYPVSTINEMLKNSSPTTPNVTVAGPDGAVKTVTLLHVPTSFDGALVAHHPMGIEAMALPLPPDVVEQKAWGPGKRKRGEEAVLRAPNERRLEEIAERVGWQDPVAMLVEACKSGKPSFQFKQLGTVSKPRVEITVSVNGKVIGIGEGASFRHWPS
jgi:hypothetical protein